MTDQEIQDTLDEIRDGLQKIVDDLNELEHEVGGTDLAVTLEAYTIQGLQVWVDAVEQPGSIANLSALAV